MRAIVRDQLRANGFIQLTPLDCLERREKEFRLPSPFTSCRQDPEAFNTGVGSAISSIRPSTQETAWQAKDG
jgi:hypothetical protein